MNKSKKKITSSKTKRKNPQQKIVVPDLTGLSGKREDGTIMPIEEFAEMNKLPFNKKTQKPTVERFGEDHFAGWEMDESTGEVYYAALIPDNMETPIDYLDDADSAAYLDPLNARPEDIIEQARRLYDNEGIVNGTINALIDNAVTDRPYISNVDDPTLMSICESWVKNVNYFSEFDYEKTKTVNLLKVKAVRPIGGIETVFQQAIQALLIDGDWVNTEFWAQVPVPEIDAVIVENPTPGKGKKKATPGKKKAEAAAKKSGGKSIHLPIKITTHNVLKLEFSEAAAALGLDIIEYQIPGEITSAVTAKKPTPAQKAIAENTPPWMVKAIKSKETKIVLPGEFTTHIKRKALDWELRGRSSVRPFFAPMADKIRLRNLDRSTIAGIIQRLTILMLGNENPNSKFHQASIKRWKLFRSMMTNMKTSMFMLWAGPNDIKPLDLGPDGKILSLKDRYAEVDADLGIASQIPRLLIDGTSSGTSARDFSAFVSTIGKLEVIRRQLKVWADRKLREIAVENGYENEFPELNFRLINLRDEQAFKSLIIKAFETSLIGRGRALREIGWNATQIINEQLKEAEQGLNELLLPPSVAWGISAEGAKTSNPNQDTSPGRPKKAQQKAVLEAAALLKSLGASAGSGGGDDNVEEIVDRVGTMVDALVKAAVDDMEGALNSRVPTLDQIEGLISGVEASISSQVSDVDAKIESVKTTLDNKINNIRSKS